MKQYALIAEEYITTDKALLFPVVTNFQTTKVIASHLITDASGQESEVFTNWITFRWVESSETGFTSEQLACIEECKTMFNTNHTTQIDFTIIGDVTFAQSFDDGRLLKNTI